MPVTYGVDIQNEIASLLSRGVYSNLTTAQKTAIDGNVATDDPAKGAAGRANDILTQYASAYTYGALAWASIPSTWRAWFVLETAMQALAAFPSAEATTIIRVQQSTRADAIGSSARVAFNSTASGDIGALTVDSLRAYAISNAIRANDKVIVDPPLIDAATEEAVIEVWNEADWSFKESEVTVNIAADGTVTYGGSVKPDRLLSDRIRYNGTAGGVAALVDRETIEDYRATTQTNGQPTLFHLSRSPSDLVWMFERTPDKAYTAQAFFTLQTPAMSSVATMNAGLALFPVDFYPIIRNRVLATALSHVGRVTVPAQLLDRSSEAMRALLPRYDKVSLNPPNSAYTNTRPMGMGASVGYLGGGGL